MKTAIAIGALVAVSSLAALAAVDCESERCAVQSTIDARCPCAQATTHGAHVRCVAHVVAELAADGVLSPACKRATKRCAARSTCGRPAGAVVCDIPRLAGTCAVGLGFCRLPDGSTLYTHPCSSDADCVIESRCRISASAERCVAKGGTVATRTSCCPGCAAAGTPCGPALTCPPTEMCVVFGPIGPGGFTQTCHPVPVGCELDRTCGCVSAALCPAPHVCRDVDAPGDTILCECTACQ